MGKIQIHNIVTTIDFKDRMNLEEIASKSAERVSYDPEVFPGLVYRMANPKITFLIFSSGKITCTGAKSMGDVNKAAIQFQKILKDMEIELEDPEIRIQNIVASLELGRQIKFDRLLRMDNIEYDPEQFPGLVHKTNGVAFLIFASGKIVCVGTISEEKLEKSLNYIVRKLEKIKAI